MKPELFVNAHHACERIHTVKLPSLELVGSRPATYKCLDQSTVTMERPSRNVSVPGADESWMDGLSAGDVIRQYGIDPNVSLTPEGKIETPSGEEYFPTSSEGSDYSSSSDECVWFTSQLSWCYRRKEAV